MFKRKGKNMNESLIVDYKNFLNNGKTERECVTQIINIAKKLWTKNIDPHVSRPNSIFLT